MQYVFEYKFNICINVGIISWQLVCYYLYSFALNVLMMQQQHINKNNTTAPMRMQQSLSCWIKPENNHSNWRCIKTNSGSVKSFFFYSIDLFSGIILLSLSHFSSNFNIVWFFLFGPFSVCPFLSLSIFYNCLVIRPVVLFFLSKHLLSLSNFFCLYISQF